MVTAFSSVEDVRKTATPDLKSTDSALLLLDLGAGKNRMGGSTLAQVYNQIGNATPDLDDPEKFVGFFNAVQELLASELILSYHDRSDGGLLATLAEMAIAGRKGMNIILDLLVATSATPAALPILFAEELGAVIEIDKANIPEVMLLLAKHGISDITRLIGNTTAEPTLTIGFNNETIYSEDITTLNRAWSELSYHMQTKRDNPKCAQEEYDALLEDNAGIIIKPTFDVAEVENVASSLATASSTQRPKVAIFREQGINGQNEMAFAFDRAGFESVDVHMTDLLGGTVDLADFAGLVACGGFSYGDVLGAGSGWAKSVLYNPKLKAMFTTFFAREDSFTLGVCNGCQMISQLKDIIPGAEHWPQFVRNRSEQFEARYANVEVMESPSIFFKGMEGSLLPIPVAHGEGRADFSATGDFEKCLTGDQITARYIDFNGEPTETYPANPNGSPAGATGFTTADGRATIMMPHPERLFRSVQMSYKPDDQFTGEAGPWLKMFQNARNYVG
jgi:phosphoribosylformylglycinamidine synthase